MSFADLVNPLQGSQSIYSFSTGNTYPAIGLPRGMTYWTPQTSDERFIFSRNESKWSGFRATHSPSPWMGDYGHFDVMGIQLDSSGACGLLPAHRAGSYDREALHSKPYECAIDCFRYNVQTELTATTRCALMKLSYPDCSDHSAAVVLQTGLGDEVTWGEIAVRQQENGWVIEGVSQSYYGHFDHPVGCYFVCEIENAKVQKVFALDDEQLYPDKQNHEGKRAGLCLQIKPEGKVLLKIATSFISLDQARLNLKTEIASKSYEQVRDLNKQQWEQWLSKIEVEGGSERERVCFYSALYRVGLFPTSMHEPTEDGVQHYSPFDGQVHSGVLYTNNGFWDTHRTVYPLLSLIDPEGFAGIIDGYMQAYRYSGWLPKWASPGFRNCMIGTHIDSVVAEALNSNVQDVDYHEAYEALRKNAFTEGDTGGKFGRLGLKAFRNYGYVPDDIAPYSVSRTLDFSYSDWCVMQVAEHVNADEDVQSLAKTYKNYKNLWNDEYSLMLPRNSDGSWNVYDSMYQWGGAYIEGSAWQHSFSVPHDINGFAELVGGKDKLADCIQMMMHLPPRFEVGPYGHEIHEMTEMVYARDSDGNHFGQYAHSNQPVHAYLWMLATLGCKDKANQHINRVIENLYTPDNLPGDEDNGEMSAWYIFAALGFYPVCPGSGKLIRCSSGIFDKVVINSNAHVGENKDPSQIDKIISADNYLAETPLNIT
ncbi:GH92 family glycosyl hydrolase [Planctomycetota bacterium]|nr:GH92 family glycosyl hydrolase [Planctomycetota bacterium]